MRMNALIPMAGNQPDLVGTVARGHAAGRQAGLADLYREQGAGIANGDPASLNALAGFDPNQALGVKRQQQVMQHADQRIEWDAERMDMVRENARRETQRVAAGMQAAERQQAVEQLQSMLRGATHFFKTGDKQGYDSWLQKQGADPAEYRFEDFPANAAAVLGSLDVLAGPKPLSPQGKVQADINSGMLPQGTPLTRGPLVDMSGANFGPQGAEPDGQGGLVSRPEQQSVPENVDFSDATGASGFISQLANTASDAIGLGLVDPNNETATQAMQNLSTNTMIALADGVAGKPSNFLLNEFQKLSSQPNSIWQGRGRTKERLGQTRAMIEQSIMMNQDVANTSESKTDRSKARANIARLSRLLSDYDAVIGSFGKSGPEGELTDDEALMNELLKGE